MMPKSTFSDRLLAVCMLVSLLGSVAFVWRRYSEVQPRQSNARPLTAAGGDWLYRRGVRVGDSGVAPPVLFVDLRCPACARMLYALDSLRSSEGSPISLLIRHFPLESVHPGARERASALECAARHTESFDLALRLIAPHPGPNTNVWDAMPAISRFDSATVAACLQAPATGAAIDQDIFAARRVGVPGTPVLVYRDSVYVGALSANELRAIGIGR